MRPSLRRSSRSEPIPHATTILVAEDDTMVRAVTARVLGAAGYTVIEAADGEQALDIIRSHAGLIDLLVSDIVMPNLGGVELAKRVVARAARDPHPAGDRLQPRRDVDPGRRHPARRVSAEALHTDAVAGKGVDDAGREEGRLCESVIRLATSRRVRVTNSVASCHSIRRACGRTHRRPFPLENSSSVRTARAECASRESNRRWPSLST